MKRVQDVISADLCHGCGACVAAVGGQISMALDDGGFLRPKGSDALNASDQATAIAVCSGVELEHASDDGRIVDPLWGPLLTVETGYAVDADMRFVGSSGGVISALVLHLLEAGRADAVVQVAAHPRDPIGNTVKMSRNRAEVRSAAGSRYAPSSPLATLGEVVASGERFVFIGKPCDVAALRRLAQQNPKIDRQLVLTVSFMCAGMPSRHGTLELLSALGAHEEDVESFAFRGEGWPGFARARLRSGDERRMDYAKSWGQILNKHLQFRCKICPDGTGEFADVVCADAWYGEDGYPDFAERDGRSLVLARSEVGRRALDAARDDGRINLTELAVGEIAKMQPYQAARKRNIAARLLGVALAGGQVPRFRRLGLLKAAASERPLTLLRNFTGTFLRVLRRRHRS